MLIKYNNIKVHKRELIKSGEIEIKSNGCYILKGKNGQQLRKKSPRGGFFLVYI